ncbi:MAG: hypothetical protein IH937_07140 [Acidobacteria bacterium]|nr:hypothetical protein [Acidobacteriota bacterium]
MEVEAQVFSEDPLSGNRIKTSTAFLTFVALAKEGRPTPISPLIPETEEKKGRYPAALRRRRRRLREAKETGAKR